jgi:cell wall-associated NlpC family hydrolase
MPTTSRRFRPALLSVVLAVLAGILVSVAPVSAPKAHAMTLTRSIRVVDAAASRRGSPYQWGATGPHRFDCSGLTQWSYKRVGRYIPRTSRSQYRHTRHISRSQRRVGDLVFFHSGRTASSVYHVGIYAGRGKIWHAPHTGARVRKEAIWTRNVWYGRVR